MFPLKKMNAMHLCPANAYDRLFINCLLYAFDGWRSAYFISICLNEQLKCNKYISK